MIYLRFSGQFDKWRLFHTLECVSSFTGSPLFLLARSLILSLISVIWWYVSFTFFSARIYSSQNTQCIRCVHYIVLHYTIYQLNLYRRVYVCACACACAFVSLIVYAYQHIYLNIVFHAWNVLGINPFIRLMATSVEWNLIELPHDLLSIIYTRSLSLSLYPCLFASFPLSLLGWCSIYRQILTLNNQTNRALYLNHRKIWRIKKELMHKKQIQHKQKQWQRASIFHTASFVHSQKCISALCKLTFVHFRYYHQFQ